MLFDKKSAARVVYTCCLMLVKEVFNQSYGHSM